MEKRMEIEQLSPSSVDDHDGHHRNRAGSAVPCVPRDSWPTGDGERDGREGEDRQCAGHAGNEITSVIPAGAPLTLSLSCQKHKTIILTHRSVA